MFQNNPHTAKVSDSSGCELLKILQYPLHTLFSTAISATVRRADGFIICWVHNSWLPDNYLFCYQ